MNLKDTRTMSINELRNALSKKYGERWLENILKDKESSNILDDELIIEFFAKMTVMEEGISAVIQGSVEHDI